MSWFLNLPFHLFSPQNNALDIYLVLIPNLLKKKNNHRTYDVPCKVSARIIGYRFDLSRQETFPPLLLDKVAQLDEKEEEENTISVEHVESLLSYGTRAVADNCVPCRNFSH